MAITITDEDLADMERALANIAAHPDWQTEGAEAWWQDKVGVTFEENISLDQIRALAARCREAEAEVERLKEECYRRAAETGMYRRENIGLREQLKVPHETETNQSSSNQS